MTLVHHIRQAVRPIIQAPTRAVGEQYLQRACGSARKGVSQRPLSTTTIRSYTPSTNLQNDSHVSPFKKQRQTEFLEEMQNEDSLFDETHPRLQAQKRMSVPEFIEKFHEADSIDGTGSSENTVTVCGRVRSKRVVGKNLLFIDIVNEFQRLQVMVNRAKCMVDEAQNRNKFLIFRNLIEVGDHISITGIQTRTKAGELTLEARALPELLSPAMEQIPEKLTDPKTRMQDRHVDMLVNREVMDTLRMRSEILKHMREHFHSKRFLEFQTPILAENAGGAIARPFVTQATEFRDRDLAMRIAPELWLKRLVIGGVDKVFEIGPSFRNEGVDATHNPEFTMCEFYSAYSNLEDLIKETEELLCSLAGHASNLIATQLTSLPAIDLAKFQRPFKQVEFIPALEQAMDIRMPKLSAETAMADLLCILKLKGIHIVGETPTTLSKLLDRLAAMYIEPMSFEETIFIINHPQCMSPLAKSFLCPKTYQLVSARAELFINGRELANMYEEENNPEVQKQKLSDHRNLVNRPDGTIAIDAAKETASEEMELDDDGDAAPLDQSFVRALDYGLPPTGGWGCGVERLVMLFSGANRITDCLSFGTLRNVVGLSADEAKKTDKN